MKTISSFSPPLMSRPSPVDHGGLHSDERSLSSPAMLSGASSDSLAESGSGCSPTSTSSTSLDSLSSRRITQVSPDQEGTLQRVDSASKRAMTEVSKAYNYPAGVVTWARNHIPFLGPQESRREEMQQKASVKAEIQRHPRQKSDHGVNAVITTSAVSQVAGAIGLAATTTHFVVGYFKLTAVDQLISHTICPAISIAEGGFMAVAHAIRIVRQTRIKNAASEALALMDSDQPEDRVRAIEAFLKLVGAPGTERAERFRSLRWSLGQAETGSLMVIAKQYDQAVELGAEASDLESIAATGLALLKRCATRHLVSSVLQLILSLALVGLSIAILLNPFSAPLALAGIALSILSVAVSTHRGIEDQAFRHTQLNLPQPESPRAALAPEGMQGADPRDECTAPVQAFRHTQLNLPQPESPRAALAPEGMQGADPRDECTAPVSVPEEIEEDDWHSCLEEDLGLSETDRASLASTSSFSDDEELASA